VHAASSGTAISASAERLTRGEPLIELKHFIAPTLTEIVEGEAQGRVAQYGVRSVQ
jgi:hypothetical protein